MDRQEIILVGVYKSFRSDAHFYVEQATPQEIAAILVQLSNAIEPSIYSFAGIDTKKIDSMLGSVGSGMEGVLAFLRSFKRDALLPAAQNKSTLLPVAESYLLNRLFTAAGIAFKPTVTTALKPQIEKPEDQIAFIGNCKGWFAVKKLSIDPKTQDWEVAGILSTINHTLVNKAFDFAGPKSGENAGGRKSLGNMVAALSSIDGDNPYAVLKTCENFGYRPCATPEILMDEYPGVKPPKVKGRKPKG